MSDRWRLDERITLLSPDRQVSVEVNVLLTRHADSGNLSFHMKPIVKPGHTGLSFEPINTLDASAQLRTYTSTTAENSSVFGWYMYVVKDGHVSGWAVARTQPSEAARYHDQIRQIFGGLTFDLPHQYAKRFRPKSGGGSVDIARKRTDRYLPILNVPLLDGWVASSSCPHRLEGAAHAVSPMQQRRPADVLVVVGIGSLADENVWRDHPQRASRLLSPSCRLRSHYLGAG